MNDALGRALANKPTSYEASVRRTGLIGIINEEWLLSVGFHWHEMRVHDTDRYQRHYILWLGEAMRGLEGERRLFTSSSDLGIELALRTPEKEEDGYHTWLRSDLAGRYSRFLHTRYLMHRLDLVAMIEGLTGQAWDPANNWYGSMRTPEHAAQLRAEDSRLDRVIMTQNPAHCDIEKDDTRAGALPEDLQAAVDAGRMR